MLRSPKDMFDLVHEGEAPADPIDGTYSTEAFIPIGAQPPATSSFFPRRELLFKPKGKKSAEAFFQAANQVPETAIQTDLALFDLAIDYHMLTINQQPVSINLSPYTFFDDRFLDKLRSILLRHPSFSPANICLEITEHGGIPKNFNPSRLVILKTLGFSLALDDFDPRQPEEWQRLELFAPYLDIVKLPFQMMREVRENDIVAAVRHIKSLKEQYPKMTVVMEGFRETDMDFLNILAEAGIDIIQESSYVESRKPEPDVVFAHGFAYFG